MCVLILRLFLTPFSNGLFEIGTVGCFRKSFATALRKSGIINFLFHDLRHFFVSKLVMAGVDLNTVRELMGHQDITMTLRYSHLAPSHKQRAVDRERSIDRYPLE
ncbi:MAG: tyrosine-type recombinase/integrase [Candidatus Omnitrophica bacterium]|nr:tyrosine-type recombinase/integrase [Candidatus Omnitrophota bacterium]